MNTLDLNQVMVDRNLSNSAAREWVRRRLKDGYIWSRMNPDLLSGKELLPYIGLDQPPQSPAELIPFPVSAQRFKNLDPHAPNFLELLAQEKIRWSYQSKRIAGPAILRRIVKQFGYYNTVPSNTGYYYYWFELNPETSPYWPLMNMIFPALGKYSLEEAVQPKPPGDVPGEAWQSSDDDYGASLRFSAVEEEESVILAVALSGKKPLWVQNYRLNPDRYTFIRQQLFYLLGSRMEPWQAGDLPKQNSFRGMIYRKPKKQ